MDNHWLNRKDTRTDEIAKAIAARFRNLMMQEIGDLDAALAFQPPDARKLAAAVQAKITAENDSIRFADLRGPEFNG